MASQQDYKQFKGRLNRIEKAHRKGYGFEARGTLGRSATCKREWNWGGKLRVLLVLIVMGFVLKGVIHFVVGPETYDNRIAGMAAGTGLDPFASRLMAADPVTRMISAFIGQVFPQYHAE